MTRTLRPIAICLLALAACTDRDGTADRDQAALAKIQRTEQAQMAALARGDLDGFLSAYAPDAIFINGAGSVGTPDGIRANFARLFADPGLDFRFVPGPARISGDLAYSSGRFAITRTDRQTGEATRYGGTNLSIWARQPDGLWKIAVDHNAPSPEIPSQDESDRAVGDRPAMTMLPEPQ